MTTLHLPHRNVKIKRTPQKETKIFQTYLGKLGKSGSCVFICTEMDVQQPQVPLDTNKELLTLKRANLLLEKEKLELEIKIHQQKLAKMKNTDTV